MAAAPKSPKVAKRNQFFVALVIGLLAAGYGYYQLTSSTVDCGGEAMAVDDICDITKNGSTTSYTYDEQKSSQSRTGYIGLGVGALFLLGAGWSFIGWRRASDEPATAAVPPAPPAPPAPPVTA